MLRRSLTVGSRIPALCTSIGRVLLAGLSPEACAATLANSERHFWTHFTTTELAQLQREIAKVGEQSWNPVVKELEIGAFGIAVSIRGRAGNTVAAINLSTNLARHSPKALVKNFLPRLFEGSRSDRAASAILERPNAE